MNLQKNIYTDDPRIIEKDKLIAEHLNITNFKVSNIGWKMESQT